MRLSCAVNSLLRDGAGSRIELQPVNYRRIGFAAPVGGDRMRRPEHTVTEYDIGQPRVSCLNFDIDWKLFGVGSQLKTSRRDKPALQYRFLSRRIRDAPLGQPLSVICGVEKVLRDRHIEIQSGLHAKRH